MGAIIMNKTVVALGVMLSLCTTANAELVQQFKDPTFSGNGWASQVLTIEQMRQGAQNAVDAKKAGEAAAISAAAANTPVSKFMALFTGQVYSQLATQLTNNLFKECTTGACSTGNFMVTETQQIMWTKLNGSVTLNVYDGKIIDGKFVSDKTPTQTITVPISSFSF
jgi:hypothetical protein